MRPSAAGCWILRMVSLTFLLCASMARPAEFAYRNSGGTIEITQYLGQGVNVVIPDSIDGSPVTAIGCCAFMYCDRLASVTIGTNVTIIADHAFDFCSSLTNVTIPNSVVNIGEYAFACALSLKVVTIPDSVLEIRARAFSVSSVEAYYFQGSTPSVIPNIFEDAFASPVIYHLPGASGWGPTFAGYPTALWLPRITTNDEAFGVRSNQFGFTIDWASGQTVVIEASAGGSNPIWLPISTNKLVNSTSYFADPGWTNHPTRFYRLRSR